MLENRLYQSRLGRAFSAAVLAGTLAFSSPAQADFIPGRGCESAVPGAVEIGYTGYCTDRFGVIYGPEGEEVRNAAELRSIRGLNAYPEAREAATALYEQLEAERARRAAQPSPLEERAAEPAPPRRGPPPPYLRHPAGGGERGQAPPSLQPPARAGSEGIQPSGHTSYSNIDDDTEKKKGSDYVLGTISLLAGVGGVVVGAYNIEAEICQSGPGQPYECNKTLDPFSLAILVAGGGLSVLGIYLLSR